MADWGAMLRAAVAMGLSPEAFWRLSLKEWRMLTLRAEPGALGRRDLDEMMRAWPDDYSPSPSRGGTAKRSGARVGSECAVSHPTLTASRSVPPHKGEGER